MICYCIFSCKDEEKKPETTTKTTNPITETYPEAQHEIKQVLDSLFTSIKNKDVDQLLSFHLYNDKFTEFRGGLPRTNAKENEAYERQLIESISAFEYKLNDLKINVFEDVAIVTCNANLIPTINDKAVPLWRQITLVFVKYHNTWKITHEHLSPLQQVD